MANMAERKETIALRLTPDALARVARMAEAEDRTRSAIARRLIETALAQLDQEDAATAA